MSEKKEIEITIKKDGTIDFDQIGWNGINCDGAIDDLINEIGKVEKKTKKNEFYNKKVKIKVDKNR